MTESSIGEPQLGEFAPGLAREAAPDRVSSDGTNIRPMCGEGCGCSKCNGQARPLGYVYAIGGIDARFPSKDVQKEFLQIVTESETMGVTDRGLLFRVLSRAENLYLAREMCWLFQIQGVATYLINPRSQVELTDLIAALRQDLTQIQYDVIIGLRGPMAPPEMCDGMVLPIVTCNRLYSFSAEAFSRHVPLPKGIQEMTEGPDKEEKKKRFQLGVLELFNQMLQLADNSGDTDEHRALNYASLKYPDIYTLKYEMINNSPAHTLASVEVRPSSLGGGRSVKDIIFIFSNRATGVPVKFFTRVDVTGQFPFLVNKLQPYYDRG